MKKSEKKMILILVLVSIFIIGVIYVVTRPKKEENKNENNIENIVKEEFVKVQEDGTKVNISNKLKEEEDLDGLKIRNIRLTENNGQSTLLADVTNTTSTDVKDAFFVNITLLDKEGKEIDTILGIITPVKAGQTITLNAGIEENYANAYDFKVVKK